MTLQWSAVLASGAAVAAAPIPASAMWNCPSAAPGSPSPDPCAGGAEATFQACLPAAFTVCSMQRAPAVVSPTATSAFVGAFDLGSMLHSTGGKGSLVDVLSISSPPNYTVGASVNNVVVNSTAVTGGSWFYTCFANGANALVPGSTCTYTINGANLGCTGVPAGAFGGALAVNQNLFLNKMDAWAIAEIIVFSRVLSGTEVASINAYLANKYAIGLLPPSPPPMPPRRPPPPPSPAPPTGKIAGSFGAGLMARYNAGSFRATNASQWVRDAL